MTRAKKLIRGGVVPPDNNLVSRDAPIGHAVIPSVAVIPLLQHVGKPAVCQVKPGDLVREGMLIGRADGIQSANVHASIPGRVAEVRPFDLPGGASTHAVVIELGGEFDRSGKPRTARSWENVARLDLLGRIQAAGIVGLGGGLLPTHLKLAIAPGTAVPLLVANGVDSEPSMSADRALMREKGREIVEGLRICRSLLGAERVVLALGEDSEELVPAFETLFRESGTDFRITVLPSRYPQGNEQLVLSSLDGGTSGRPRAPAPVVLNVGTLHAVHEAVVYGAPLIERVLTVTGSPVAQPQNIKARLGTSIGDLFEECDGFTSTPGKIVVGGPMRGVAITSLETPVMKGTSGVMAFSRKEARLNTEWPCIRCGSCVEACPWELVPTRLYKLIKQGEAGKAEAEGLSRCTECGCCAFACPSHIPLVDGLRAGKQELKRNRNA